MHDEDLVKYNGEWQGFINLLGTESRVVLKILTGDDDQISAAVDLPDDGDQDLPVKQLTFHDGYFLGELDLPKALIDVQYDEVADEFSGSVTILDTRVSISLRKDHPDFKKYDIPRLSEAGERVHTYTYRIPDMFDDGLEVSSLQEEGLQDGLISDLVRSVLDGQYFPTHNILILRNGKLVLEEYFFARHQDRLHDYQSCTKSVTSILAGIAIDQNHIKGLDQLVYTFFPERKGLRWIDEKHEITLQHILTMTAALDWNEDLPYTDPHNDNTAMNDSEDWIGYVLDKGIAGKPGEKFMYTSGLSILLGGIINYFWFAASDGTRHTGGGLSLRPRDAAKIGLLMLNNGRWNGVQIVSENWVRESTARQTKLDDYGYGYQWHLRALKFRDGTIDAICAMGYGGQFIFILPALDMVVIVNAGAYSGDSKSFEKLENYILPAVK
jgi:CubicO group peptidase (beta-lactamase class C family)